jgi:drug/metabolite transporter (DMT)-like permease
MLLMPICFLAAIFAADLDSVLSVFWISPILTMMLGAWLLRERITIPYWLITIGGWVGALLLTRPSQTGIALAAIPALGMAGCLSFYLVMTRMLRDESTLTNLTYTAACVLVPLSVIMPLFWHRPSIRGLALMALIGLLGLGVLFGFDRAIELAPVSTIAPMLYVQPVAALALATMFGETHPGRSAMLGTTLILAMCTMTFVAIRRQTRRPATDAGITSQGPVSVQR